MITKNLSFDQLSFHILCNYWDIKSSVFNKRAAFGNLFCLCDSPLPEEDDVDWCENCKHAILREYEWDWQCDYCEENPSMNDTVFHTICVNSLFFKEYLCDGFIICGTCFNNLDNSLNKVKNNYINQHKILCEVLSSHMGADISGVCGQIFVEIMKCEEREIREKYLDDLQEEEYQIMLKGDY